jgi:hypothetical protein
MKAGSAVAKLAEGILANLKASGSSERIEHWLIGPPSSGPEGLAGRGFFVNPDTESLKRPLIYVNTAHSEYAL